MVQLFAIQSCPILHGPVIVFDPRDVEILKQLGESSTANENKVSNKLRNYPSSLVRDLEEAKSIRKGKFKFTKQLPDLLPKSIHTTMAARILTKRRRVPFEQKTVTTYTQAMKYFKQSPAAKETIEGKQFDLKKPTVGITVPPPAAAPKPATIVQEAPRTAESTEKPNNDKPEEVLDEALHDTPEEVLDEVLNDTPEVVLDEPLNDKPEEALDEPSNETDKVNKDNAMEVDESAQETTEKVTEETPDIDMETEPEPVTEMALNDIDKSKDGKSSEAEETVEEISKDTEKSTDETPTVNMEPLEVEIPEPINNNETEVADTSVNKNASDEKNKQDEGTKPNSPASIEKEDTPQVEDSTSPGALLGAAELVKLRRRAASIKARAPEPAAPTAAPKKRGKVGRPPKNKSASAADAATPKRRGARLPTKANATQPTEPPIAITTGATQVPNAPIVHAAGKSSHPKKRGRKAKPVEPQPSPAAAAAAEAAMATAKPPGKKRGRPKAKQVAAESAGTSTLDAQEDLPQPQPKKRGRPSKTSTAPPKKRGRPKNPTKVAPAPAVTPGPPPADSNDETTTNSSVDCETADEIQNYAAAMDAAASLTPTRKPRVMGNVPSTPKYDSDDDESDDGEILPTIESPTTEPAGAGHFSTRNAGAKWNEKFFELFRYKMQYGNCNVSTKSNDNPHKALGEWVRIQRRRKNGKSKSLKPLSLEEEAKLNAIGFDWRSTSRLEWENKFQELVKYKMAYGNADVPDEYPENPALGIWCSTQREYWRQKIAIEKEQSMMEDNEELPESGVDEDGNRIPLSSPMTDEEEGKLLALGFRF